MKRKYEKPTVISKELTIQILNGNGTVEEKVNSIIRAVSTIEDQAWLVNLCLKYMNHEDQWIAGAAINGLGDIARIFGRLDMEMILKKLDLLRPKRKELAGKIEDAIDDIKKFKH